MSLLMFSGKTGRSKVSHSKSGTAPIEKFVKEDKIYAKKKDIAKKMAKKMKEWEKNIKKNTDPNGYADDIYRKRTEQLRK